MNMCWNVLIHPWFLLSHLSSTTSGHSVFVTMSRHSKNKTYRFIYNDAEKSLTKTYHGQIISGHEGGGGLTRVKEINETIERTMWMTRNLCVTNAFRRRASTAGMQHVLETRHASSPAQHMVPLGVYRREIEASRVRRAYRGQTRKRTVVCRASHGRERHLTFDDSHWEILSKRERERERERERTWPEYHLARDSSSSSALTFTPVIYRPS